MKLNLKTMYEEDITLLEKTDEGEGIVVKSALWESGEGKDRIFGLNSKHFDLTKLSDLTDFINEITVKTYDKRGTNNLYVIRGNGHKEPDEGYNIYEKQIEDNNNL